MWIKEERGTTPKNFKSMKSLKIIGCRYSSEYQIQKFAVRVVLVASPIIIILTSAAKWWYLSGTGDLIRFLTHHKKGWQHYGRLFWENLVYLITSVFYSILLCVNIKNISNDTLQRIHVVEFQYCLKVPNSWYFLVAVRVKTSKIKRVYQRFG